MSEICGAKMMQDWVPNTQSLFCNRIKGHEGTHSHTFPHTVFPEITQAPTEMTSLREIKDKLDAIIQGQSVVLARLDAMDAGLHETAMRNHQQIRALLDEHDSKFTEHFTALFDGNAAVVEKFNEFIDKIKKAAQPRKARKKARR